MTIPVIKAEPGPAPDWGMPTPGRWQQTWARGRRMLLGLVCAVLMLAGAAVATSPASQAFGPDSCDVTPYTLGNRSDGLPGFRSIPGDKMPGETVWPTDAGWWSGDYTLYEVMGTTGLSASMSAYGQQDGFKGPKGDQENNCDIVAFSTGPIVNFMLTTGQLTTELTIKFRQFATDPKPMVQFMSNLAAPVEDLRDEVFIPGMLLVVTLCGAWMILPGSAETERKKMPVMLTSLGLLVVGSVLLTSRSSTLPPSMVDTSTANNVAYSDTMAQGGFQQVSNTTASRPNYFWATVTAVDWLNQFNSEMSSTLLGSATGATDNKTDWCALSDGQEDRARRMFDCILYKEMALKPWMNTQYGELGSAETVKWHQPEGKFKQPWVADDQNADLRLLQLHVQGRSIDYMQSADTDAGKSGVFGSGGDQNMDTKYDSKARAAQGGWNQIREVMWEKYNADYTSWQGRDVGSRMGSALMGLFLDLLVLFFMAISTVGIALWQGVLVILFYIAAPACLIGAVPWFQRVMWTYLSTWGSSLSNIFMFQLLQPLSVLLLTGALLLPMPGLMKAAVMGIFAAAMMKLLDKIRAGAANVNMGGAQAMSTSDVTQSTRDAATKVRDVKQSVADGKVARATKAATVGGALAGGVTAWRLAKHGGRNVTGTARADMEARSMTRQELLAKGVSGKSEEGKAIAKANRKLAKGSVERPSLKEAVVNPLTAAAKAGLESGSAARGGPLRAGFVGVKKSADAATNRSTKELEKKQARDEKRSGSARAKHEQYMQELSSHRDESRQWDQWVNAGAPAQWRGKEAPKSWTKGAPVEPLRPGQGSEVERLSNAAARQMQERRSQLNEQFRKHQAANPTSTFTDYVADQREASGADLRRAQDASRKLREESVAHAKELKEQEAKLRAMVDKNVPVHEQDQQRVVVKEHAAKVAQHRNAVKQSMVDMKTRQDRFDATKRVLEAETLKKERAKQQKVPATAGGARPPRPPRPGTRPGGGGIPRK